MPATNSYGSAPATACRCSVSSSVAFGDNVGLNIGFAQHLPVAALVGTDPLDLPGRAQLVKPVPDDGSRGAEGGGDFAAARGRILAKESQDAVREGREFW